MEVKLSGCLMKLPRLSVILGFLVILPLVSSANQNVQARFENSLKNAKSLGNIEIEFLDTLRLAHGPGTNEGLFSRTYQYSYIASGPKFRAECKLVSGTRTNLMKLSESAFDGNSFYSYSADKHYMTKAKTVPPGDSGVSALSPLIAPLMFLAKRSDECRECMLRFTDVVSGECANGFALPDGQMSNGVFEISFPGLPLGKQPTHWKITFGPNGDSFTPDSIENFVPGFQLHMTYRLLNYTNLAGYQFPTRIERVMAACPPNSPPTVRSTGTISVISARIPDRIEDSVFRLEDEEKSATAIWDWDQKGFVNSAGEKLKPKPSLHPQPDIYDESADGSKQIAEALAVAAKEHKRVLLQFGANWCSWCHKLHDLFEKEKNVAEILKSDYVVVLIDVNKRHNQATDTKYEHPTRFGLPAIVVLDSDGRPLITQNTGKLEEGDHHSPDKVMAFLKEWAPKK